MSTEKKIILGLATAGAAAAYGWAWRRRYNRVRDEYRMRLQIVEDAVPGAELIRAEMEEFDSLAEFTCLQPCCYEFEDGDSGVVHRFWVDPNDPDWVDPD